MHIKYVVWWMIAFVVCHLEGKILHDTPIPNENTTNLLQSYFSEEYSVECPMQFEDFKTAKSIMLRMFFFPSIWIVDYLISDVWLKVMEWWCKISHFCFVQMCLYGHCNDDTNLQNSHAIKCIHPRYFAWLQWISLSLSLYIFFSTTSWRKIYIK